MPRDVRNGCRGWSDFGREVRRRAAPGPLLGAQSWTTSAAGRRRAAGRKGRATSGGPVPAAGHRARRGGGPRRDDQADEHTTSGPVVRRVVIGQAHGVRAVNTWPRSPCARQNGYGKTAWNLTVAPIWRPARSWSRASGRAGVKVIWRASGGGTNTAARRQRNVPAFDSTATSFRSRNSPTGSANRIRSPAAARRRGSRRPLAQPEGLGGARSRAGRSERRSKRYRAQTFRWAPLPHCR